ncbi:hypothetical protein [Stenotrophomonas sp.]|uniref:DUF7668 domain-containing protein n=1 Tax=Stenotrophomonas sp. TaxID=69392 RepID=UPI0028A8B27A|nr:hypothetical protein [Stenotrophomonas sp.]
MNEVAIAKDGHREMSVPEVWRPTLVAIVDALVEEREPSLPQVVDRAPAAWSGMQANVREYGARLKKLPEASWESSVCIWYGSFWDVLVDLHTEEEGRSDLVLQVHIHEDDGGYRYEVVLVYVP